MLIWSYLGKQRDKSELTVGHPRAVEVMCGYWRRLQDYALEKGRPRVDLRIAIFAGYAGNKHSDVIDHPNTREVIDIAKSYEAPIILFRLLFDPSGAPVENLTSTDYLIEKITDLRLEAAFLDIQDTGFETEAYRGGTRLCDYMRGDLFTGVDYDKCAQAVRRATDEAGRVSFVTPAGHYKHGNHPYKPLAQLGNHQIAQGTYYDRPEIIERTKMLYDYTIAGLHCDVTKGTGPKFRFAATDVLIDRTEVCGSAGRFIWTEDKDLEVARAMVEVGR